MSLTGSIDSNIDDAVINRIIQQLGEDIQIIDQDMQAYSKERADAIQSQKVALARYHQEVDEINREFYGVELAIEEANNNVVDHNVMRHLNIDKESDQYKQIESYAPKKPYELTEVMLKNISELQHIGAAAEQHPPPTEKEKSALREKMFNFLEESRIEETRLELEYEQSLEKNNPRESEEIAEALYLLQKLHQEKLNDIVSDYRPSAFGKAFGADPDYAEMVKTFDAIADNAEVAPRGGRKKKKKRVSKKSSSRSVAVADTVPAADGEGRAEGGVEGDGSGNGDVAADGEEVISIEGEKGESTNTHSSEPVAPPDSAMGTVAGGAKRSGIVGDIDTMSESVAEESSVIRDADVAMDEHTSSSPLAQAAPDASPTDPITSAAPLTSTEADAPPGAAAAPVAEKGAGGGGESDDDSEGYDEEFEDE